MIWNARMFQLDYSRETEKVGSVIRLNQVVICSVLVLKLRNLESICNKHLTDTHQQVIPISKKVFKWQMWRVAFYNRRENTLYFDRIKGSEDTIFVQKLKLSVQKWYSACTNKWNLYYTNGS